MQKEYADKIITEYMEKIFGFALSKIFDIGKAEELASRIVFDVYKSLLKSEDIHNINGYIYRVAHNVYARFVDEEIRGRYVSLDEVKIPCGKDFSDDFENSGDYIRLRREISYLGGIQRKIIIMYYYEELKQHEISKKLGIPLGTVKWHLYDARKNIKEGMNMNREMLGVKPIKFDSMGHSGSPGPENKDTNDYLSKLISQNIAYAAYHKAKTITEIASDLSIPAAFVEDEVNYLEENGFMDKVAGGKYLTNICITEPNEDSMELMHKMYMKYAEIICDKYVPLVFDSMKNYKKMGIYTPKDNFNFLMWSAVTYSCGKKLYVPEKETDTSKYMVKHKDGGVYIAFAEVERELKLSFDRNLYNTCGNMNRGNDEGAPPVSSWQLNTYYDDRTGRWRNNLNGDYYKLYDFMANKPVKSAETAIEYSRLYEKGYVISENNTDYVNMVVVKMKENEFISKLPEITAELKDLSGELDEAMYKTFKKHYPEHMQDLCRAWNINCFSDNGMRARVLERLFANGILQPLSAEQKHSVNTILFSDILPK